MYGGKFRYFCLPFFLKIVEQRRLFGNSLPELETDSIEKVRLDKLETILKKSTYFENSTFKNNEAMDKLTVDDKYDISISNILIDKTPIIDKSAMAPVKINVFFMNYFLSFILASILSTK